MRTLPRLAAHYAVAPDARDSLTLPTPAAAWRWATRAHTLLAVAGLIVLGFWAAGWKRSYDPNVLGKSPQVWFEPYRFLGLDFLHNYFAARHWLAGGNPYREPFGDPIGRELCYPPVVLPFFAWCQAFGPRTALGVWIVTLGAVAAGGTYAAWRARAALGLAPVPLTFALAAILASAPVMYAMERGNYDLLLLPLLSAAAWALQARSVGRDALAGGCLALAVCFKVYPALVVAGLIPLRRVRAAAFAGLGVVAFAGFQAQDLPVAVANLKKLARVHKPERGGFISPTNHSLGGNWRMVWAGTRLHRLAKVPANVAAAALLGPALLAVGYRVYRCPDPRRVVLPFFLWVAGVATFVPTVANDYSLFFVPLAALAVWDRRDPVFVHVALGLLFLWAQPIRFAFATEVILAMKLLAVYGIAVALVNRVREQSADTPADRPAPLPREVGHAD